MRGLFDPPRPAKPQKPKHGELVSVEGEVVRITYENHETGFRVLRVQVEGGSAPEPWVGKFPPAPPGTFVRATGRYEQDSKHGEQLRVETLLPVEPNTTIGIERYLASGVIKGIGEAFAKRIVETFGDKTLSVLDRDPDRLYDVPGLGEKRAEAIQKAWEAHRAVGAIMIFLQTHGASPGLAARIHKRFGSKAIDIASRQPYRLALDVWGVGFKTADRIARSVGIAPDSPERAQAGVMHVLHEITTAGHVYAFRAPLVRATAAMLEQDESLADRAIDALAASGHVKLDPAIDDGAGNPAVYAKDLFDAEESVADRVAALLAKGAHTRVAETLKKHVEGAITEFEKQSGVALADAQREAVDAAARHPVLVVTGGPGVGKTTIVKAILAIFKRAGLTVRLAAPTGRAAKRMSEATKRDATTLHRLLEVDPKRQAFSRNRQRPIDADAVVVDEASMLDIELSRALFDALADGTRLVVVGDVDQLPSVGPGAVLRDLIRSAQVPTVRLTRIFRQAAGSLIVENAHRIHDGELPFTAKDPSGPFHVVVRHDAEGAATTIREMVAERIPRRFGLDPRRDVQVLCPMHKGAVGTEALNAMLQEALNPEGPSPQQVKRGATTFRLGDKVMQLRNDAERDVYNGDAGTLVAIDVEAKKLTVRFDDDREAEYEEGNLAELGLSYAISIHKSQGSEYPAVVIPMLTEHFVMLSRNLLYTAVTRGKKLVVLVTNPKALGLALSEIRKEERQTWLAERIRERMR